MLERLQKIIARAGIASRRHAEDLIRSGQVLVNGVVVTELGAKADPERDRVEAAGRVAEPQSNLRYFALNKPIHVVSTMSDPEGRATLRHLLRGLADGVFPVGGLDYAASGLMLLTNDGELADRLFKSFAHLSQVYWVKIKGRPSMETLRKIEHRAHARLNRLRSPTAARADAANPWYEAQLRDAPRDVLRRELFDAGHPVEKMRRVKIGPLELGDVPDAHYRELAPNEVARLRRAIELAGSTPAPAQVTRRDGAERASRGPRRAGKSRGAAPRKRKP
jgi:23S rRNA pseudouridine2605 synthase